MDSHISRGTVYRNLEQFTETGRLLRVKVPGPDRYDSRLTYHYHLVCKRCGTVQDVPMDYQQQMDREVADRTGFQVERHRMIFEGLCAACQPVGGDAAAAE